MSKDKPKVPSQKGILRAKREEKRKQAVTRQQKRGQRSDKEQLLELDRKLGVGKGANKERDRLYSRMTTKKV